MAFRHLLIHRDGPIEYLTLNRSEVRNAFNDELAAELTAWTEEKRGDQNLRAVVLSGAGQTFCAGADVRWMSRTVNYTEEENVRDATAMSKMFTALDTLPFALVGKIHGAALGGGAGLVAVCDIVVAAEAAMFGFTEVKLGILPAVISPFVVAKIGVSAARELFLSGARFSARRAREIGLVHAVVDGGSLEGTVASYIREILTGGPEALAAAKALIPRVAGQPRSAEVQTVTATAIASRRVSAEGQEGLKAFLEKRQPAWAVKP
jgi:methylglutaconyl-CoA hydratase